MASSRSTSVTLAFLVASAIAGTAQAANGDKTYAAFFGSDANNCFSPPTACRTAQRAIDQTNPGGEVVFDNAPVADFGAAEVDKPLTLNFQGNQMDVPLVGTPTANLIINTAVGNDTVSVLGLNMNLHGANRNGIQVLRGNLFLNNTTIQNGGGSKSGLLFQPNRNAQLTILNSVFGGLGNAVTIQGRNGADVTGFMENSQITQSGGGVSLISPNGTTENFTIRNSVISNNQVAVHSEGGGSTVNLGNTLITGNTIGLEKVGGGDINSLTGNQLFGNGTNGIFTTTINPQ